MLLQLVYAVLQLYGWYQWTRAGQHHEGRQITRLGAPSVLRGLVVGAAGSLMLGAAMAHWTDAAQPWLDAALTGFSIVAQWWMAQNRVQRSEARRVGNAWVGKCRSRWSPYL